MHRPRGPPPRLPQLLLRPGLSDALEATHERLLGEIREIELELDYPATYAPFPRMLLDRGVQPRP